MNFNTITTPLYNPMDIAMKLKQLFHLKLYTNDKFIVDFIVRINALDIFSNVTYNTETHSLCMKIKKTNIKKQHQYSHNSLFYYTIFNHLIYCYMIENIQYISQMIRDNPAIVMNMEPAVYANYNVISLLYNITTISDNMISIQL